LPPLAFLQTKKLTSYMYVSIEEVSGLLQCWWWYCKCEHVCFDMRELLLFRLMALYCADVQGFI